MADGPTTSACGFPCYDATDRCAVLVRGEVIQRADSIVLWRDGANIQALARQAVVAREPAATTSPSPATTTTAPPQRHAERRCNQKPDTPRAHAWKPIERVRS